MVPRETRSSAASSSRPLWKAVNASTTPATGSKPKNTKTVYKRNLRLWSENQAVRMRRFIRAGPQAPPRNPSAVQYESYKSIIRCRIELRPLNKLRKAAFFWRIAVLRERRRVGWCFEAEHRLVLQIAIRCQLYVGRARAAED